MVGGAGPYFALERWTLTEPHREPARPDRAMVLANVGEPVTIRYAGGEEPLARAESCILPAALGEVSIEPPAGAASVNPVVVSSAGVIGFQFFSVQLCPC